MSASGRQAQHGVQGAQSPSETQRGVGVLATGYHPPLHTHRAQQSPSVRLTGWTAQTKKQRVQPFLCPTPLLIAFYDGGTGGGGRWQGGEVDGAFVPNQGLHYNKAIRHPLWFPILYKLQGGQREQATTNRTFVLFRYLLQLLPNRRENQHIQDVLDTFVGSLRITLQAASLTFKCGTRRSNTFNSKDTEVFLFLCPLML